MYHKIQEEHLDRNNKANTDDWFNVNYYIAILNGWEDGKGSYVECRDKGEFKAESKSSCPIAGHHLKTIQTENQVWLQSMLLWDLQANFKIVSWKTWKVSSMNG